jgi:hypothetical protein
VIWPVSMCLSFQPIQCPRASNLLYYSHPLLIFNVWQN